MNAVQDAADKSINSMIWTPYSDNSTFEIENRIYDRYELSICANFMDGDKNEHSGTIKNISLNGLWVDAEHIGEIGETVILYSRILGRFEGTLVRRTKEGFALNFDIGLKKGVRISQSVERLHRYGEADYHVYYSSLSERRASMRSYDNIAGVPLITEYGEQLTCNVVNMSTNGAKIKCAHKIAAGTRVKIGKLDGVVKRVESDGYAIERI